MSVLVLVEHEGSAHQGRDARRRSLRRRKLGEVHALVAGNEVGGVAAAAAKIAGVAKVLVADARRA